MGWLSLKIECPMDAADGIGDAGLGAGALAVAVDYSQGRPIVEDGADSATRYPDRCTLAFLLPERVNGRGLLEDIAALLQWPDLPPYTLEPVADWDWVRENRRQFEPMRIGTRLWVVPTWHCPPDPNGVIIVIDPGLAFGTGAHPTTELCLQWLDRNLHGGETVLDYGCGSGILAIGALKLGAAAAVGIDNDPHALETSRANARLNTLSLPCFLPGEAPPMEADLVMANILANPLVDLAPTLAQSTAAEGRILLSGFLAAQAHQVEEAYRSWFRFAAPMVEEGWVCLAGERRS